MVLLGGVTAIYAGECMEVDLSALDNFENVSYMVVGNSSNINGMNITFNDTTKNASICFAVNYKPDIFTLVFFAEGEEKVTVKHHHHYHSSGSSSDTVYIENKTTEYVDVPTYLDREVYIENNTILKSDDTSIIDELPETSWSWWYLYGFLFVCSLGGIYYWLKNIYISEENEIVTEE